MVTSLAEISAGDTYYITGLRTSGGAYWALPELTASEFNQPTCIEGSYDSVNDEYTAGSGASQFVFEAGPKANTYYIKEVSSGKYLVGSTSNAGKALLSTSKTNYWTFSVVGSTTTFSAKSSSTQNVYLRSLASATNAKVIRVYSGASNQGLVLFKYQ